MDPGVKGDDADRNFSVLAGGVRAAADVIFSSLFRPLLLRGVHAVVRVRVLFLSAARGAVCVVDAAESPVHAAAGRRVPRPARSGGTARPPAINTSSTADSADIISPPATCN